MGIALVLFYAGILLIFCGIVGFVAYSLLLMARRTKASTQAGEASDNKDKTESRVEGGAVIFIGPIPIVFGSNKKVAKWMIIAAALITLILVVETLFVLGVL